MRRLSSSRSHLLPLRLRDFASFAFLSRYVTVFRIHVLSFLAGIYGIKFEYMPELQLGYAYFVLSGVMASIAGGLLLILNRNGWLSRK